MAYLDRVDPAEARRARQRYSCFDHLGTDGQAYGYALAAGVADPCEDEVVTQLLELHRRRDAYLRRDGWVAEDEQFTAEQNARLVRDAEEYYHQLYRADVSSWNLRDRHMARTLTDLLAHLDGRGGRTRAVVWAHNSHVGDARATGMGARGELTLGQLARERWGDDTLLVGCTTYDGQVTAASDWGGPTERKHVRPARPDSYEAQLHDVPLPAFWLPTRPPGRRRGRRPHPAGTGHRRHLPSRDRTPEPLLRGPPGRAVRRRRPHRPDPGTGTAGADPPVGPGRATRDVPDGDGDRASPVRWTLHRDQVPGPARGGPPAGRPPGPPWPPSTPWSWPSPGAGCRWPAEVARALGVPLDILLVRKLGLPSQPELGFGAVGEGGVRVLHRGMIQRTGLDRRRDRRRRGTGAGRARPPGGPLPGRAAPAGPGRPHGGHRRRRPGHRGARPAPPWPWPGSAGPGGSCWPYRWPHRESACELGGVADDVVVLAVPDRFRAVGEWVTTTSPRPPMPRWRHHLRRLAGPTTSAAARAEGPVAAATRAEGLVAGPSTRRWPSRWAGRPCTAGSPCPGRPRPWCSFAHGSGSSRRSPRNEVTARMLHAAGLGTLLFDLLTPVESDDRRHVFDVAQLAGRLRGATGWVRRRPGLSGVPLGYFGASTGAAAALWRGSRSGQRHWSRRLRGGRPDLAGPGWPPSAVRRC